MRRGALSTDRKTVQRSGRRPEKPAEKGIPSGIFNVGESNEWPNTETVRLILRKMGKPGSLIRLVKNRSGRERRSAIDLIRWRRELGRAPVVEFDIGTEETIGWYLLSVRDRSILAVGRRTLRNPRKG